ncbi:MAG: Ethyl tert-butyl ether degradation EthD [Segetibacter sp.]|nr:Ethyl tert-butyl ether degradation EthD [Segetibacter sp.]
MYKVTVLYEHPTNEDAFETYLREHHVPLAQHMTGVSRIELTKFETSTQGVEPEFYRMAEIFFISREVMQETMGSPEGQAVINDMHNLTSTGVRILLGTVEKE